VRCFTGTFLKGETSAATPKEKGQGRRRRAEMAGMCSHPAQQMNKKGALPLAPLAHEGRLPSAPSSPCGQRSFWRGRPPGQAGTSEGAVERAHSRHGEGAGLTAGGRGRDPLRSSHACLCLSRFGQATRAYAYQRPRATVRRCSGAPRVKRSNRSGTRERGRRRGWKPAAASLPSRIGAAAQRHSSAFIGPRRRERGCAPQSTHSADPIRGRRAIASLSRTQPLPTTTS
jgi:hypothetical protein